jgi:hypothetical protein
VTMEDVRFKRLPQWAQQEIKHLLNRVERAEDEVARLLGRESNIEYNPGGITGMTRLFLPDDKEVRFNLPEGYVDVRLRLPGGRGMNAVDRAVLEVCGHEHVGDDEFVIMPRSGNLAHIGFRK